MALSEMKQDIKEIKEIVLYLKQIHETIPEIKYPDKKLLKLQKFLQVTFLSVVEYISKYQKHPTAEDISKITGISRSVESCHLNKLVYLSYLKKYRHKRKMYFTINIEKEE